MSDRPLDASDPADPAAEPSGREPGYLADVAEAELSARELAHEDLIEEAEAGTLDTQTILAQAHEQAVRARAAWSLIHKELLLLLFANCLFFAGVLAAWSRGAPGDPGLASSYWLSGLDTIRGALIFALAIHGFWIMFFNVWFRQMIVWPYLLNALLALWVGIPGFTGTIGSAKWEAAQKYVDAQTSKSLLDPILTPLATIPAGHWLLTLGGAIVLIVLLKGILAGMSQSKSKASGRSDVSGGGSRYRRR
jgi:hypothetical protein